MSTLGNALESLQCAAQEPVRQELCYAVRFLLTLLRVPCKILVLLATVSGDAALAAGGLEHQHLAACLTAVVAHDARHCHCELKTMFRRAHRLVLVAQHAQQPRADS